MYYYNYIEQWLNCGRLLLFWLLVRVRILCWQLRRNLTTEIQYLIKNVAILTTTPSPLQRRIFEVEVPKTPPRELWQCRVPSSSMLYQVTSFIHRPSPYRHSTFWLRSKYLCREYQILVAITWYYVLQWPPGVGHHHEQRFGQENPGGWDETLSHSFIVEFLAFSCSYTEPYSLLMTIKGASPFPRNSPGRPSYNT